MKIEPIGQLTSITPLTNKQRFDSWKGLYECFANLKDTLAEVKKECSNLEQVN